MISKKKYTRGNEHADQGLSKSNKIVTGNRTESTRSFDCTWLALTSVSTEYRGLLIEKEKPAN
jgi:hypothetical protein